MLKKGHDDNTVIEDEDGGIGVEAESDQTEDMIDDTGNGIRVEETEKRKRKRNCLICPHGKRKDNCVEVMCGGCPHRRRRVRCADCGGHGICEYL